MRAAWPMTVGIQGASGQRPGSVDDVCTDVYLATMDSRALVKELQRAGWIVDRIKGSHHTIRHPNHGHALAVPHPKKDLGTGVVEAIGKQAGL